MTEDEINDIAQRIVDNLPAQPVAVGVVFSRDELLRAFSAIFAANVVSYFVLKGVRSMMKNDKNEVHIALKTQEPSKDDV